MIHVGIIARNIPTYDEYASYAFHELHFEYIAMQIEFIGAAREVTGSCHILRHDGKTILLDCGMFQGRRAESNIKNRELPVPVSEIDAVILSHAHIDHSGRLPFLVKSGYDGNIFATPATRDLCAVMLADSAHIQQSDANHLARRSKEYVEPLYSMQHAVDVQRQMIAHPYGRPFEVLPGITCTFLDAGHILGSASVVIDYKDGNTSKRLVFSGDIGRSGLSIIRNPVPPHGADTVIMESTYGGRSHEPVSGARDELARVIRETAARGGRIMIPAFAVGRTQELIYSIHSLLLNNEIPRIPVYVDSPLATDTTTVFELHPDVFDNTEEMVRKVQNNLFDFDLLKFTRSPEESKKLNTMNGPMIVIAASGMMEAGRILHHLQHGASNSANTILIVGFQAEGTLGRRIVEKTPIIRVFGDEIPLRAKVEIINGYSAHADESELTAWLDAVKTHSPDLKSVFLVHGEPSAQDTLKEHLAERGYSVVCPHRQEKFTV